MADARRTFSAPAHYWDILEDVIKDGYATNASEALRFVLDEYRRAKQGRDLVDAAARLGDDEWLDISGLGATQTNATAWPSVSDES